MLKRLELSGFKSFAKKTTLVFDSPITCIVGPNGSGKSNIAESFRWVLGEQSLKSLRGKRGEDLIFNGSNSAARLNHASVSVAFDNTQKRFNVDYDEVVITREVFRDGSNEYAINGTKVRLRDVLELLGTVSLGPTGHHIISQGEADHILNANIYERRSIIEEALGLNIFQWKIVESEKKLGKTEENIKEVESLRREIAPHLKFLKKQVEKIEKADEMRRELKQLYLEYLKKEEVYLAQAKQKIAAEKGEPARELAEVEEKLKAVEATLSAVAAPDGTRELSDIDRDLRTIRGRQDDIARQLGRLEGMIEIKGEKLVSGGEDLSRVIDYKKVDHLLKNIDEFLLEADGAQDLESLKTIVRRIKNLISNFSEDNIAHSVSTDAIVAEIDKLKTEKTSLENETAKLAEDEKQLSAKYEEIRREIEKERDKTRGAERELYELRSRRSELRSHLEALRAKEERWQMEEQAFKTEVGEAVVLVDREILNYGEAHLGADYSSLSDRSEQENRRKQIERLKIRLEDMGVEGIDVMEEYKQATERDAFLEREHEDLVKSKEDLRQIIKGLKEKLDTEFKTGITKINQEFGKFFALMFGGGAAGLEVIAEQKRGAKNTEILEGEDTVQAAFAESSDAPKEGIDINVNLPRKKIKGLQMLSGGERALTSIALLFAMSQVNPPPFLILDETDAALDEANSRKYGDMIANLSRYSQLIVITHNRETMSRAGIIYGVTMGGDAISKLLSIKFEEAEAFAK